MEVPRFRRFPGKILLFGEYLVIQGEQALAIPIQNFAGELKVESEFQVDNIAPFIQYLGALPNIFLKQDLIESMALDRLVFESNIPIGYGAGSSGALTAAIFDAFVEKHDGSLREALASMEDFFHGSSSGLDPLVSYTGEPTMPIKSKLIEHFYLIDTKIPRKTGPLVDIFKQKAETHSFEELVELNKKAIRSCEVGDLSVLNTLMPKISEYQFEYFQEMIPKGFEELWKKTIGSRKVSMKLCGAGGGGFLLVFASRPEQAQIWAREEGLELIQILF